MKIDLAVWTAVNGYDWQPGSVYSPRELAGYKDEIGPLVPDSLPVGGLFLKDGRVVFYRVQIAERMDSRGRGAIYCVLGTVPEDRAKEIDFSFVFNSAEMTQPQKPFPTAIEFQEEARDYKSSLGRSAFDERRFTGAETFSELGGWCGEAKGGKLIVRITGNMEAPLFTVNYKPHVEPVVEPPKPQPQPQQRHTDVYSDMSPRSPYNQPVRAVSDPYMADASNLQFGQMGKPVKSSQNSFLTGFVVGTIFGVILMAIVAWLARPSGKENLSQSSVPEQQHQDINYSIDKKKPQNLQSGIESRQTIEEQIEKSKEARRKCPECGGQGVVKSPFWRNTLKCSDCSGRGTVICPRSECHSGKVSCSSCNGDGWIAE